VKYTFVNNPAVKVDIIEAISYYKSISPELAKQFLFRLKEAKIYVARSPFGFQIKYNQVRILLLKQFPYHIHYIVDDAKQQIVILAIIHAYRNPKDYSNR
jgi:hypothetical protein